MQEIDPFTIKDFWENNPLCASVIPYKIGSKKYFNYYDGLREKNEPPKFSEQLHEYKSFSGKRVLDVGCGNGYVLSRYSSYGADTYGIDITEKAIELCKKRFELSHLNGEFATAPAEKLPFENDFFDCVCSMGVLHHVSDTQKAIDEIYRVLKPGGKIILMFYHRNSAYYQVVLRLKSLIKKISIKEAVNQYDGFGNPRGDVYSKKDLQKILNKFTNLEIFTGYLKSNMLLPVIGKYIIPAKLLRMLEKKIGWFIYVKANK
jgi:ubiquinone/menaquinone biosynthesis C-methylase UbiE